MDIERDSSDHFFHGGPVNVASASSSPSSSILGQTSFYSLPPSPTPTTLSLPSSTYWSEADQISTSATSNYDGDSHWDELQTCGRLRDQNESDDDNGTSQPRSAKQPGIHQNMLFAVTAICDDHTVLSPPLKLPPRLRHEYHFDSSNPRSSASSSQSPVSLQRVRISRNIFKSEEFDPFLVAMKNVTAEGRRRAVSASKLHDIRRASSFSSAWASSPIESRSLSKHLGPSLSMGSIKVLEQDHDDVQRPIFRDPKEVDKDPVGISVSKRFGEPKGVKKARAMRLVKMGCCEQSEPIIASINGPIRETGACIRMKKPKDENKRKSTNTPLWKVTFFRVFCFKRVQSGKDKTDKNAFKLVRLTVVLYRPRFSFCLGVPRNAS